MNTLLRGTARQFSGVVVLPRIEWVINGRLSIGPDGIYRGTFTVFTDQRLTAGSYHLRLDSGEWLEVAVSRANDSRRGGTMYFEGRLLPGKPPRPREDGGGRRDKSGWRRRRHDDDYEMYHSERNH